MFSKCLRHAALLPLVLLALGSCSVREERSDCPCLLTLDFSSVDVEALAREGADELSWVVRTGDFSLRGRISLDALPAEHVVEVPREEAELTVLAGDEGLYDPAGSLLIPEGEECPPLRAFSVPVDATQPELLVPVQLHKRYACLEILLRDLVQDGSSFVLRGSFCGYGADMEPLPGPFLVPLVPDGSGTCRARVPAQRDGSLSLCIYRFGELDRVFALGTYILDSGYDWWAEDLEDIRLEIDYVLGAIRFKIDQWSKTLYFTIAV